MVTQTSTSTKHYDTIDNLDKRIDENNEYCSQENITENEYDQEFLDKLKKEREEDDRTIRWLMSVTPEEKKKNKAEWNRIRWELVDRIDARLEKSCGFKVTNDYIKEWKIERYGQEYYDRVYGNK
jgi:hypothetical protein